LIPEGLDGRRGRSAPLEGLEQQPQRALDLLVRIENRVVLVIIRQADRQVHLQLPAARGVQHTPLQAGMQYVEFCLAHGPLETQEQAVIEMAWIIDAVFIE